MQRLTDVLSNPQNAQRKTLTVAQYAAGPCGQQRPVTVGGRFGTFHVIVRNVPDAEAVCSNYVLLETPINTSLQAPAIGENDVSLLFDTITHQILFSTPHVIGRETAFYLAGEQTPGDCPQPGSAGHILDGDENAERLRACRL